MSSFEEDMYVVMRRTEFTDGDWEQLTIPLTKERAPEALKSFSTTYRESKLYLFKMIQSTEE